MTDGDALLRAIRVHPAEDVPRLAYADWLDEHGQPDRGEFIRVQCRVAIICGPENATSDGCCPGCGNPDECDTECEYQRLRRRERELAVHAKSWWNLPLPCHEGFGEPPPGTIGVQAGRGWPYALTLSAADWLAHADALLAAHPVTRVRLTTPLALESISVRDTHVTFRFPGRPERRFRRAFAGDILSAEWPQIPPDGWEGTVTHTQYSDGWRYRHEPLPGLDAWVDATPNSDTRRREMNLRTGQIRDAGPLELVNPR